MVTESIPGPVWVDRPASLRSMLGRLESEPIVAVDTESNSLYVYREQVCLVQFSIPSADYLVDPLAIPDLAVLSPFFANPRIEKVFHAAEYDLICLKRDFGFTFTNLFDTMIAGRVLGRSAVGLGAMLEEEFGVTLDKRFQRADWGQRPLPPTQRQYARMDTHYLIELRHRLKAALEAAGRWALAEEDFRRITQVVGREPDDWEETCWRIPGVQDLNPQQAAVLQQLCRYRDEQARLANRPLFKILSNQALFEIAQACPPGMKDLKEIQILSERQLERYGAGLLKAVKTGLESPPARRPSSPRPDERFLNRLDSLRSWRKHTALRLGVDSDVVLPRDMLYELASANPRGMSELEGLLSGLPERIKMYGEEILHILQNGYRVPQQESPQQ